MTSAAAADDLPRDSVAEIALVGRSNVGKSSLINALARQQIARTSATPGKTRLANLYRFVRDAADPFYLIDLPGYGYARGGSAGFEELAAGFFDRVRLKADTTGSVRLQPDLSALLLIDARHPALESDLAAWRWLEERDVAAEIVATKIDKLSRAERQRALKTDDAAFEHPVLPVSADTGEGLDELWILINRIVSRPSTPPLQPRPSTRLGAALSASKGRNSPPRPLFPRRKS